MTVLDLRDIGVSYAATTPHWPWQSPPRITALADVSLTLAEGEMQGLVGESGCGKSTLGRVAVGLQTPDRGTRHTPLPPLGIQLIFQDAGAALNPRRTVAQHLAEAPVVHGLFSRTDAAAQVSTLLHKVGLTDDLGSRLPHQLSGGQKARVAIARALAVRPRLLVCDEILASLDVVLQQQLAQLLRQLQHQDGLACLFISHDLAMVQRLCQRVAVMQAGRIVEMGPTDQVFAQPLHPWTRQLLAAQPRLGHSPAVHQRATRPAVGPDHTGCSHQLRCPWADVRCCQQTPTLRQLAHDQYVACHWAETITPD